MLKVLLTGFEPFNNARLNPSEQLDQARFEESLELKLKTNPVTALARARIRKL